MHPPDDGLDPHGLAPDGAPDWEAFYRDYRKPGYIEGFEITTKLGGGMFGLVFRARRMSIGKDYAIKFLKVDDGEVRRAVLSELEQVKYFAQIDHPNLVSIEDRGEVNGIPFLVMAFAGTKTLRDRMTASNIGDGKPPSAEQKDELVRAFLQSCRGLQALHERSLVHFDIKPANVFMKGGVARLGDYGLSKLVTHSRGSLSMGRGTPYYMAPEMLQRRGDARSDIYSLGVMLYELLCGKVPFTGESEWEVLRKHEHEAAVLPAFLTAVERTVLQGCLAKDPEQRFQSVPQLLAAFGPISPVHGLPVSPVPAADLLGRQALAKAAQQPPLPSCVPPPLPTSMAPRRQAQPVGSAAPPLAPSAASAPLSKRQRRREAGRASSRRGRSIAGLLVLLGGIFFMFSLVVPTRLQRETTITAYPDVSSAPVRANSIKNLARLQASTALARGRRAAQQNRPQVLHELNLSAVQVPEDFHAYREVLKPLAESPRFVPALATRAEQLGRPVMIAAVAMLQELDYHDGLACQKAENLQRLLAQMTGVDKLVVEVTGRNPSPSELCMLHAVADGWRMIAEQCAANDRVYQELLTGVASNEASVEVRSPR